MPPHSVLTMPLLSPSVGVQMTPFGLPSGHVVSGVGGDVGAWGLPSCLDAQGHFHSTLSPLAMLPPHSSSGGAVSPSLVSWDAPGCS